MERKKGEIDRWEDGNVQTGEKKDRKNKTEEYVDRVEKKGRKIYWWLQKG